MGLGGSRQAAAADSQPDSVYWAAYFGRVVDLRRMLDAGADVNQRESEYNRTPLIATAFKDRWEAALLLLERSALLEEREDSLGCTALMISAQYNATGVAQILLEAGADPDAGNNQHGQTALMWCCQYDHAQLASILLSHGASVAKQRKDTVTPLMIAAKNNAYSVAALLLDNGADPNLVGNGRFTALMICAMVDSLEVAQLLLRHGAEKAAANREGKTALILCGENNCLRVAQLLLDTGADADAVCLDNKHSAATVAALRGHLDLLRLLVEHGANVQHRCADGRGLVELAAGSGSQSMILYARRLIGDAFAAGGTTELHWAASSDNQLAKSRQQPLQKQQRSQQQTKHVEEEIRHSIVSGQRESTVEVVSVAMEASSAADEGKVDARATMEPNAEEVTEDVVTPAHVKPLGPNTIVPFEKQLLDDQRSAEKAAATAASNENVPASVWQELMAADEDNDAIEAVDETVTASQVRPLGPDTAVSFEQQQLDDQKRARAEPEVEAEVDAEAIKILRISDPRSEETILAEESADEAIRAWESLAGFGGSDAGAEVSEEPVMAAYVRPLGPNCGVPFEKQLLDDQKRAAAASLDNKSSQDKAEAKEDVTATHVELLGPNTAVPFEQQLLDDKKRAEAVSVFPEESTVEVVSAVAMEASSAADEGKVDARATMEPNAEEVTEDVVTPAHVKPLGPNTIVPFEKQLLDDQRSAEKAAATAASNENVPASVWQELMAADEDNDVIEAVDETVTASQVRPLGPDTAVSFEQQQLDDQKRARAEPEVEAEVDAEAIKILRISDPRSEETILAEESADEAIRAWESLAGFGGSDAGAEVSEEPVMAAYVRPLGPNCGVPFEKQLLDDQKRAAAVAAAQETDSSLGGLLDAVGECVTATHVQPLRPNTAVPFEPQLLDDQRRTGEADSGLAAEEGNMTKAASVQLAKAASATTTTSQATTVRKQLQKSASKFPNKRQIVTKKFVTTETTGKRVTKREVVVKVCIASEEASESVSQIEGPPQRPKWKSRRDTESQFQK